MVQTPTTGTTHREDTRHWNDTRHWTNNMHIRDTTYRTDTRLLIIKFFLRILRSILCLRIYLIYVPNSH